MTRICPVTLFRSIFVYVFVFVCVCVCLCVYVLVCVMTHSARLSYMFLLDVNMTPFVQTDTVSSI